MNGAVSGNGLARPTAIPGTAFYTHPSATHFAQASGERTAIRPMGRILQRPFQLQGVQHSGVDHFASLASQMAKRVEPRTFFIPIPKTQRHPVIQAIKQFIELVWEKLGGPNLSGEMKGLFHTLMIRLI